MRVLHRKNMKLSRLLTELLYGWWHTGLKVAVEKKTLV